jgi:hypothetical protein
MWLSDRQKGHPSPRCWRLQSEELQRSIWETQLRHPKCSSPVLKRKYVVKKWELLIQGPQGRNINQTVDKTVKVEHSDLERRNIALWIGY